MKRLAASICLTLAISILSCMAQSPGPSEAQLAAAIREIQTQQAQMAENQSKIEEKLAAIAEAVRQARIYSSRGGR